MDYVPKKDAAFAVWVRSLLAYVQAHLAEFSIQDAVFQPPLNSAWETQRARGYGRGRAVTDGRPSEMRGAASIFLFLKESIV